MWRPSTCILDISRENQINCRNLCSIFYVSSSCYLVINRKVNKEIACNASTGTLSIIKTEVGPIVTGKKEG